MDIGFISIVFLINITPILNQQYNHNDGDQQQQQQQQQFNVETINITEFGDDLSRATYGTDLILLESSYHDQRSYNFEDFFWTGSGDDSSDSFDGDYLWSTPPATTIYQTTTITSTVFTNTKTIDSNQSPSIDRITPSPTRFDNDNDIDDYDTADRQFWLLTVLKSQDKDPVILDLKNSLAKLYKIAFQRQQEQHLGITTSTFSRHKRNTINNEIDEKSVKVYIHNVERIKSDGNEDDIQVLYHVTVAGKPVAAVTAAQDMALVSDEEVTNELGYPFVIKAEPYLKEAQSQSLLEKNNTWIFIGVSIIVLLIILLFIAFLSLSLTKRKRAIPLTGLDNRQQIFERGILNKDSVEYQQPQATPQNEHSPTYINYEDRPVNTTKPPCSKSSSITSSSSSSSSSSTSLDISPLMGINKHGRQPALKKPPRPKAAINKTAPLNLRTINPSIYSTGSSATDSRRDSPDTIYVGENNDPGVISPKSYLSMPSVKSFPRGNMPEPLNKVLEPVSVLHLDMPEDECDLREKSHELIRHGSVGTVEDPGVIGPIVWNMHQQRLQHGVSMDEGIDDLKIATNLSRMRKRFHNLLDDTFSLFGSRKQSPVMEHKPTTILPPFRPIEVKSHSAIGKRNDNDDDDDKSMKSRPRPKTSDPRRPNGDNCRKGAWETASPSPLIRPSTADFIKRPKINVDHVLADGRFKINDPAVPLIAAIKSEIEKCSLPGSTTDVRL